ncbi:abc transporter permease [Leptolyngbya sp. Heron Island J]|uniref:ABC transporter permease n=1 Tax=Leptolyngbya sp. Heron Island J TaxID=1385935 RepID=UPI0003B9D410|nr:ABC transporter permease [Leptolyngbya sp. Heron Island J]ESA38909.1 abc transporter permease [Leptolyngbya sp. Heron Island J]
MAYRWAVPTLPINDLPFTSYMDFRESLKMAIKTLTASKLRSSLTMLGIIIGNASVISMVGLGEGGRRYINEQIQSLGPNILFIVPGNRETRELGGLEITRNLVLADAEAIAKQVPSVVDVAAENTTPGIVTFLNRNANASVIGTNPGFISVRNFTTEQGRFISDLDMNRTSAVAVLGNSLAERLFEDEIPLGQSLRINDISFEVVGVLAVQGSNLGVNYDDAVMIPLTTQSSRIVGRTSPYGIEVGFISATARDGESMQTAEFQIANLLRLRHGITDPKDDDFFIQNQDTLLTIADTITGALTLMLAAIASISLLVGGIGIMNIMLVSVRERTQEIGLRKAVGASQQDILIQFLIEAIILSAAGGVIGTLLGVSGISLLSLLTPFESSASISAIVLAVGVSGSIGLFFGVIPARQAAKLDPIVALRSI